MAGSHEAFIHVFLHLSHVYCGPSCYVRRAELAVIPPPPDLFTVAVDLSPGMLSVPP